MRGGSPWTLADSDAGTLSRWRSLGAGDAGFGILLAQSALVALCAVLLTLAMVRNDGTFSYSLDDPYIHLAFSEQLAAGHFGLHAETYAAPSSSILWPWLLVPAAETPWHGLVPLLLNGLALLWILSLLRQLLRRSGLISQEHPTAWLAAGLLLLVSCVSNLPFLLSTGLEHCLQVAFALALLRGLLDLEDTASLAPAKTLLLLFAIVVGPLVRYESLSLSVAAILFLLWRRRIVLAGFAVLLTALPLLGFSCFLLELGLPPLPSSVLVKSGLAGAVDGSASWASTADLLLLGNLRHLPEIAGARQLATLLGVLWATALWRRKQQSAALPLCLGLGALAHLLVGRFAATERYETYLLTVLAMLLIHRLGPSLRRLSEQHSAPGVLIGLALIVIPWQAKSLQLLIDTPQACHNIYQQQYQMHRFVTEYYRAPVAVNDLGWVSYRNPHVVLDLWGVGDEATRRARMQNDSSWPELYVKQHDVGVAMIYDRWFRDRVPIAWRPVAYLRLVGRNITPGDSMVTFYATRDDSYHEALRAVRRLRATLPPDTHMRLARR